MSLMLHETRTYFCYHNVNPHAIAVEEFIRQWECSEVGWTEETLKAPQLSSKQQAAMVLGASSCYLNI